MINLFHSLIREVVLNVQGLLAYLGSKQRR
jgi:hypothetical protein